MGLLELLGNAGRAAGADDCTIHWRSGVGTIVTLYSGETRMEFVAEELGPYENLDHMLEVWEQWLGAVASQFSSFISQGFR